MPMTTLAERRVTAAGRGRLQVARIIRMIFFAIAAIIILGILLVVFDANPNNGIVNGIMDVAKFFVDPFRGLFSMDDQKATVALNWGIGAAVYILVGAVLARLIAR